MTTSIMQQQTSSNSIFESLGVSKNCINNIFLSGILESISQERYSAKDNSPFTYCEIKCNDQIYTVQCWDNASRIVQTMNSGDHISVKGFFSCFPGVKDSQDKCVIKTRNVSYNKIDCTLIGCVKDIQLKQDTKGAIIVLDCNHIHKNNESFNVTVNYTGNCYVEKINTGDYLIVYGTPNLQVCPPKIEITSNFIERIGNVSHSE